MSQRGYYSDIMKKVVILVIVVVVLCCVLALIIGLSKIIIVGVACAALAVNILAVILYQTLRRTAGGPSTHLLPTPPSSITPVHPSLPPPLSTCLLYPQPSAGEKDGFRCCKSKKMMIMLCCVILAIILGSVVYSFFS
ncbi:hypothetical protein JZ751_008721 [Albula glossodonta]|uniref:Uncharacterized protein n=1 Tax=Albula glossodonta TaxID=121402 RepID=A0A8T2PA65_9TELE|nr:hypothetical protein JZ751_008721 [Albula glossodonta]